MIGKYKELTDIAVMLVRTIFKKNEVIGQAMLKSGNQRWQANLKEIVDNNKKFNKNEFAQIIYNEICKSPHKNELLDMFINCKDEKYIWFINTKKRAKLSKEKPIVINTYYRNNETTYLSDKNKMLFAQKYQQKMIKEILDFYNISSQQFPTKYISTINKNINSIDDINFNTYKSVAYTIDKDKLNESDIELIKQNFNLVFAESINKYIILGYININLKKYHLHSFDDKELTLIHLIESSCKLKVVNNVITLLFNYTDDKLYDNESTNIDIEMCGINLMKIELNNSLLNLLSFHNNLYLSGYLEKTKINYAKTS